MHGARYGLLLQLQHQHMCRPSAARPVLSTGGICNHFPPLDCKIVGIGTHFLVPTWFIWPD
jgi:hypothetical protein